MYDHNNTALKVKHINNSSVDKLKRWGKSNSENIN